MATSERARRARPSRHHGSRSNTGRVRPEIIPSATFAGQKPGYAFKSGAHGMGYYLTAENPAQPFAVAAAGDAKPLAAGLHSVANMHGTWGCMTCCIKPPLWVSPFPNEDPNWFETQSMGTCGMNWPCCDAHGFMPPNPAPRRYVRTPGTNTFQSTGSHQFNPCGTPQPGDQHTAVLIGERQMTVDGKIYYWGPSWVGGE